MTTANDPTNGTELGTGSGKPAASWTGKAAGLEKIDIWVPLLPHYDYQARWRQGNSAAGLVVYVQHSPETVSRCLAQEHRDGYTHADGLHGFAYQTDGFLYYATQGRNGPLSRRLPQVRIHSGQPLILETVSSTRKARTAACPLFAWK